MREEIYNQLYSEMVSLIDKLNYHTHLYDAGKPIISDKEWDDMYFRLLTLEHDLDKHLPGSPTQRVTYQVVNELNKVKHNHPMLSLDKTKDWNTFIHYFNNKDVIGMLKLDGLTCSLRYVDGMLVSAETRGNGEVGEDILHNALVVRNIPKRIQYNEELILDGEIICTAQDFKSFENEYANPRNFAAGSIRLLDSNECAKRNLKFVVWNVVKGPGQKVIDNFIEIMKLGFTVVPWTSSWDWDAKEFLLERAEEFGYPIDGLVGRFNDIAYGESLGATGHHSRAAYAFKFYDEIYTSRLVSIDWTMGRTGILTPVAIIEPIEMDGCEVTRASLHNLSIMKEILGQPYVGQEVKVFKANEIIPQIKSAKKMEDDVIFSVLIKKDQEYEKVTEWNLKYEINNPTNCPICGEPLKVECEVNTEVLRCVNNDCAGRLVNRLDHFCGKKGLDIKGLSKATLEKLVEWEWVSQPADLYALSAKRGEWIAKPGFGEKSVDKILQAIEKSRKVKLDSFISALGIPMIGKSISKELVQYVESYEDFKEKAQTHWDFTQIDKIALEKASAIWRYNFMEADEISKYVTCFKEEAQNTSNSLNGAVVCITGRLNKFKNRPALVQAIEKAGGKVSSSVSKNTDWLINNDINSKSTKNVTAEKLGVSIITEEEFFNLFLDN
jgi:DNA ligase (NAD+)